MIIIWLMLLIGRSVLIDVHTNLNDDAVESELVSRWKEIGSRIGRGIRITGAEWNELLQIKVELEAHGIEIIHCELGRSVEVWLWCRTEASVAKLRTMIKNARLRFIIVKLYRCLLTRAVRLTLNLSVKPQEFQHAADYFLDIGNYRRFSLILTNEYK